MFGYGGGWAVLMVIGMLAFLALVVWVVYAALGGPARRNPPVGPGPGGGPFPSTAHGILDVRLARGEIDTDEYHRLRGVLTHDKSSTK